MANTVTKAIYDQDDRKDLLEVQQQLYRSLARSTAAQIPTELIGQTLSNGTTIIRGPHLSERGICANERFAEQQVSARCSGFLVAPDLIMTAGHCMTSIDDCLNSAWVFDFHLDHNGSSKSGQEQISVPETSIYFCNEIVSQQFDHLQNIDYALVRLNHIVSDRAALAYRQQGKIADDASLVVMGHPSGLPLKITDHGIIRDNRNEFYFVTNLDTYGGNSGSAVFDAQTGIVEGILLNGETDYVPAEKKLGEHGVCFISKHCQQQECSGEAVGRITNIKFSGQFF